MCKMYSKSIYYFNDITLSRIWKTFFWDKTYLYWFSDYWLFLLTVYKYSRKFLFSWATVGLGNNFNKHKKGFTFGDIIIWLVKEEDIRRPNSRTQVPHYMFILLKTLKKDLAVDHWQSQLSTICIFFMN